MPQKLVTPAGHSVSRSCKVASIDRGDKGKFCIQLIPMVVIITIWFAENLPLPSLKCASCMNHGRGGWAAQLFKTFNEITHEPKKTTTEPIIPDNIPNNSMAIPPKQLTRAKRQIPNTNSMLVLINSLSNQQVRSTDYLGIQSVTACNDTCIRGD